MVPRPVCLPLCILLCAAALAQESFERNGTSFTYVPWGAVRPAPTLKEEETKLGWVTYVPGEQDGIGAQCFPTRAEIGRPIQMFACAGQTTPATFAVYAQKAIDRIAVQAGPLVGTSKSVLPSGCVDVRSVRLWRQRTSWNATTYYVVPELLQAPYDLSVPAGAIQQFWVTVRVPLDARAGHYEGALQVTADGKRQFVPLKVRVLPIRLISPPGKCFGLWSDTGRWRKYSEEQILDEVRDWKAHGINSAIMYPLAHGKFTLRDGELRADLSEFSHFMDLYSRVGMDGPIVASCQGISALVHRLLGQQPDDYGPAFKSLMLRIIEAIEDVRKAHNWPEFFYHTVDEPGGHPAVQREAIETLRILHEAGYKTFCTADVTFTNANLAPYLSARCYGVGFCARSEADALARRAECEATGAAYWWYGTGCYTGQEGHMAANRYLGGFLFDKSLAQGEWAWTFQRPNGDAYDDFDGTGREAKDACITYPSPGNQPPTVPTLQWEGIREGIDDARYAATLRAAIADVRKKGGAEAAAVAARCERGLKAALEQVPWLKEGRFGNSQAQLTRWKIASLLLDCARQLTGEPAPLPAPVTNPVRPGPELTLCVPRGAAGLAEPPLPVAYAPRLPRSPVIDGRLGTDWDRACHIAHFVAPDGSPERHRTEAWIGRDASRLLIAFRCHEDGRKTLLANVHDHDGPVWSDDSVEVFVDVNGDGKSYAHFGVNSLGTRAENWVAFRSPDPRMQAQEDLRARVDEAWNPQWEAASAPCEDGWCVEIAIPFFAVRGTPVGVWNVNLNRTRRVSDGPEYCCWSPTLRGYHVPSRFGRLVMTDAPPVVAEVTLSPALLGEGRLQVRLDNSVGLAQLDLVARVGASTETPAVSCLLGKQGGVVDVPVELSRVGDNEVVLGILPRSAWIGAPSTAASRRASALELSALGGQVKPVQAQPLSLRFHRWVPQPLELGAAPREIMAGQTSFDVHGTLAVSRRLERSMRLRATLYHGGTKLSDTVLERAQGDDVWLNVGTADLQPGAYKVRVELEGLPMTGVVWENAFTVIPGPW